MLRTVTDILEEARMRADAETNSPTTDFVTTAELLVYFNKAYRSLLDLIIGASDAAVELLVTSSTLTSPYTLPADFYRVAAVDIPVNGDWRPAKPFQFRNRNDYESESFPRYRVVNGALTFSPTTAAPASVKLWYVAFAADKIAADSIQTFNGWDDYIVATLAADICTKEDRDPQMHLMRKAEAIGRIRDACADLMVEDTLTLAVVERQQEEYFDLI